MMKTIKLFATLRDIAQSKEITVDFTDGQTVAELITTIGEAYPQLRYEIVDAEGQLTGLVHILVRGRHIEWLDGLETTIAETDEVVLLPPSAGG